MTNTHIQKNMQVLDTKRDGIKALIAGLIIALAALFFVGISAANGQTNDLQFTPNDSTFTTLLSSEEEVPPTASQASGRAHFVVAEPHEGALMRYQLIVHDGQNITAAHLHCGPRGVNGPVVVNLYTEDMRPAVHGELASGVIRGQDILAAGANCSPNIRTIAHLAQAMREGKIHVNVHSTQYPGGDIRGQILMHMPYGWNTTGTPPIMTGTSTQYTAIPNGVHVTARSIDIREVNSVTSGTSRFVITVSHDLLRQLRDILPNVWQMIQSVLNR